jgi:serine/threonine protein phosphatase PrpC
MVMTRRKRYNQDALCVHESFAGVPNLVLLGVFDGHGKYGHLVSEYVRTHIPEHFDQLIQNDETPGLTEKAAMR